MTSEKEKMIEVVDREDEEKKPVHPIIEAVKDKEDDPDALRKIFDQKSGDFGDPLTAADESGMTALMYASWKGKIKSLNFLIQQVNVLIDF